MQVWSIDDHITGSVDFSFATDTENLIIAYQRTYEFGGTDETRLLSVDSSFSTKEALRIPHI